MSDKSDQLRSRLPRLAAELDASIEHALAMLCAVRATSQYTASADPNVVRAWRKGLDDAMLMLRPATEAHDRFRAWMKEVLDQEVDHCGLTAAEREEVFGRMKAAG